MKISSLAKYVKETNNCTKGRGGIIDTITIHCTASANEKTSSKPIVDYFASTTRQASCNYAIGGNGPDDISCGVREEYRAWTSGGSKTVCGESGSINDYHAITIEVVSNKDGSVVLDQAIENTIRLCVDICQRYGKTKAIWFGDNAEKNVGYRAKQDEMKFTWHKFFANKACPGPYIMSKFQYIIDEINKRLGNKEEVKGDIKMKKIYTIQVGFYESKAKADAYAKELQAKGIKAFVVEKYVDTSKEKPNINTTTTTTTPTKKLVEGCEIKLKNGCTYYNGTHIPSWVFNKKLYYRGKNNNGVIFSTLKTGAITGVVKEENIIIL